MMQLWKALLPGPATFEQTTEVAKEAAKEVDEIESAIFSAFHHSNGSCRLSSEDEPAVDSWIDRFVASPSFPQNRTDCRIGQPSKQDVRATKGVQYRWTCEMSFQDSVHSGLRAEEVENSFMETILYLINYIFFIKYKIKKVFII
jgi:hypothetical protein